MLSSHQQEFFAEKGYLVVEDVFDQTQILDPVRVEYSVLLDRLVEGWIAKGLYRKISVKLIFLKS